MKNRAFKKGLILIWVAAFLIMTLGSVLLSHAETVTYATVTATSAKVRAEADVASNVVGSLKNGDRIQILSEATDASGQIWYKVNVVGGTGYIRSDLVEKGQPQESTQTAQANTTETTTTTTTDTATSTTTTAPQSEPTQELKDTQVTAMDSQPATIKTASKANVRSGAGTGYSVVGTVGNGDQVTVTGTATDSEGKTWYYITLANGNQGFIRSDLITLGAAAAPTDNTTSTTTTETTSDGAVTDPSVTGESTDSEAVVTTDPTQTQEPETQETPAPQPNNNGLVATTSSDPYFVIISEDGKYQLVDNTDTSNPAGYSVEALFKANEYALSHSGKEGLSVLNIVLIIVIVVLAGLVIFLFIRLRNLLYYDDEGDGYQDDMAAPVQEEEPRRRGGLLSRFSRNRDDSYDDYPEDEYPEDDYPDDGGQMDPNDAPIDAGQSFQTITPEQNTVRPTEGTRPSPRKSRNFAEDDDFEFEFLDLDKDDDKNKRR